MSPSQFPDDLLLDYLYGLLSPEESAALEAKLAADPAGAAALAAASKAQGLLAKAAKPAKANITFAPPTEPSVPVGPAASRNGKPLAADLERPTVRAVWSRWVVAAGVLLAVAGVGLPVARDLGGYATFKPAVNRDFVAVTRAKAEQAQLADALAKARAAADVQLASAKQAHDDLVAEWVKAEEVAVSTTANRPYDVKITGPARAVPGAPNTYELTVEPKAGKLPGRTGTDPLVNVEAFVKDGDGKVLATSKFNTGYHHNGSTITLTPDVWSKIKPGSDLTLHINTVDTKSGAATAIAETIQLQKPVFSTFLSTDRPMYRPGETVFFRSVTLDRARFLPPDREMTLRYDLAGPDGSTMASVSGLARPVAMTPNGAFNPVMGPDNKPIRGIGCGAFPLVPGNGVDEVPGGEYVLTVREENAPDGTSPILATRKFVVNKYTPDKLLKTFEFDGKTYGPGAKVGAKFTVADMGKKLADANLSWDVIADGQSLRVDAPAKTDAEGNAVLSFTLPNKELKHASVTVNVSKDGKSDSLVRSVPLATRSLSVEFFPEGGDLVVGVPTRVYFRARTPLGKPADLTGSLSDGTKDICPVATLTDADQPGVNQGLGSFTFTPEAGKTYFVKIATPLGIVPPAILSTPAAALAGNAPTAQKFGYVLPAAKADGIVLTSAEAITKPGQPIRVKVAVAGKQSKKLLVGAYVRGTSVAHQWVTVDPGKPADVTLDTGKSQMGGVARVTVFVDKSEGDTGRHDLKAVAERLVYRAPGEVLKLAATPKKADGTAPKGAFVPGETVKLDVSGTDETGKATPAILYAAVVNKSTITMADEKTARLLPTQFLFASEVQKPEDFEFGDFYLSDHPKAPTAMDLVLGTQGWRRFAEQSELFKRVDDAEVKDLVVAYGAGPVPASWKAGARKVFDDYWPKYESALLKLEQSESEAITLGSAADIQAEKVKADAAYAANLSKLGQSADDLVPFDASLAERAKGLPLIAGGLALIGVLLIGVGSFGSLASSERKPLVAGGVGMLAVAGFALAAVVGTQSGNQDWRQFANAAPNPAEATRGWSENERVAAAAAPAPQLDQPEADAIMAPEAGFDPNGPMPARKDLERRRNEAHKPGDFLGDARPDGGDKANQDRAAALGAAMKYKADEQAKRMPANGFAPPRPGGIMPPAAPGGFGRGQGGGAGIPKPMVGAMVPGKGGVFAPAAKEALHLKKFEGGRAMMDGKQQFDQNRLRQLDAVRKLQRNAERFEKQRTGGIGNALREAELRDRDFDGAFAMDDLGIAPLSGPDRLLGTIALLAEKQGKEAGKKDAKSSHDYTAQIWGQILDGMPKALPLVVREYRHSPAEKSGAAADERSDETETLAWEPVLVTPQDGKATISFTLSDSIAPYQVLVAGQTLDGRLGATTGMIEVRKPFSIDPKLPAEISSADKIDLPLVLTNATDGALSADLKAVGTGFKVDGGNALTALLSKQSGDRKFFRLVPDKVQGPVSIRVEGAAAGHRDAVVKGTTVVPNGFPMDGSIGGMLESSARFKVQMPGMIVPGTGVAQVMVYPNTLTELVSGLDGLLREPSGCFEQSSTTNYPNVLISQYLRETGQIKPEIGQRADALMDRGYRKLVGFECRKPNGDLKEGYEWFGGTAPPHEALTAYGLLQFTDMATVFNVDPTMLKRTKDYLLSARDGKGGFKRNARALDTFGRAPDHVTAAYIVWAITESEKGTAEKSDLSKEIDALHKRATDPTDKSSKDPYFLALVGNGLLNVDRAKDGNALLLAVGKLQAKDGNVPGAEISITASQGRDLEIETTALAVLGWVKANRNDLFFANTQNALKWIGKQRGGYGGFGSTQSTILALKALIEFARKSKRNAENGTVDVYVGDKKVGTGELRTDASQPLAIAIPDAETLFAKETEVRVESTTKGAYPAAVTWACQARQPVSAKNCSVNIETALNKKQMTEGESAQLNVKVSNLKATGHGMVTAIVGIPAGMKLPEDMKQLKVLTDRPLDGSEPKLSYFEIRGRELVLYWRSMAPEQKIDLTLDLLADVPGEFYGPASRAYLYYNADHKHWVAPIDVKILPKSAPQATAAR